MTVACGGVSVGKNGTRNGRGVGVPVGRNGARTGAGVGVGVPVGRNGARTGAGVDVGVTVTTIGARTITVACGGVSVGKDGTRTGAGVGVAVGTSGTRAATDVGVAVGLRQGQGGETRAGVGAGFGARLPSMIPFGRIAGHDQTGTEPGARRTTAGAGGTCAPAGGPVSRNRTDSRATVITRGMVHGHIDLPPPSWSVASPQRRLLDSLVSPSGHFGISQP